MTSPLPVADFDWATGQIDNKQKTEGWSKLINPMSTPLHASFNADNVLKMQKPYTTTSAKRKRDSIAAFVAMLLLLKTGKGCCAHNSWQACVLAPRAVVTSASGGFEAWLVVASASDAARVCRLLEMVHAGDQRRFLVDLDAPWKWLVVHDMQEWQALPYEWAINEASPETQRQHKFKHF